ncbi:MAG TPA: hypothetical protein VFU31_29795 [Candidatus Binatia bacterium]|nr:hypothetical protein [Candidatus Binatia bacterium]
MTTRIIHDEQDRKMLIKLIMSQKLPFVAKVERGGIRSIEQNRLQRLWMNEISEQLGDRTPEEARGECKLTIGVPILRAEDEEFRREYDRLIRPLPYEDKLRCMMEPIDLPVTRRMKTSQKTKYLEGIYRLFAEQGVVLTIPPDKRFRPPVGEKVKESAA